MRIENARVAQRLSRVRKHVGTVFFFSWLHVTSDVMWLPLQEQDRLDSASTPRQKETLERSVKTYGTEYAASMDKVEAAQKQLYVSIRLA